MEFFCQICNLDNRSYLKKSENIDFFIVYVIAASSKLVIGLLLIFFIDPEKEVLDYGDSRIDYHLH